MLALVGLSLLPALWSMGWIYLACASLGGALFVWTSCELVRSPSRRAASIDTNVRRSPPSVSQARSSDSTNRAAGDATTGRALISRQPLTAMLMVAKCAEGRTGEALGLRLTVNNVMRVAGPALFGAIAAMTGLTAVFLINGVMMGVGVLFHLATRGRGLAF